MFDAEGRRARVRVNVGWDLGRWASSSGGKGERVVLVAVLDDVEEDEDFEEACVFLWMRVPARGREADESVDL
jgi:hypothetical protein